MVTRVILTNALVHLGLTSSCFLTCLKILVSTPPYRLKGMLLSSQPASSSAPPLLPDSGVVVVLLVALKCHIEDAYTTIEGVMVVEGTVVEGSIGEDRASAAELFPRLVLQTITIGASGLLLTTSTSIAMSPWVPSLPADLCMKEISRHVGFRTPRELA